MALSVSISGWLVDRFAFAESAPLHPARGAKDLTADAAKLQAFEAFFRQHERHITGYLCRMLGSEAAAQDASQETFLRAWEHFAKLQESEAARAWLYRVATNLALRGIERRKARPMVPLEEDSASASDPAWRIVQRDHVQVTLQLLTPNQRGSLILHEVHGFSCDEIGKMLGISRDAVKMALYRAREQFRQHYLREEQTS